MVIMRRDVPEKAGHPVEMSVQECDIDQLQKRGWYVVSTKTVAPEPVAVTHEPEKTETEKTESVEPVHEESVVENKTRRSPKRHEV